MHPFSHARKSSRVSKIAGYAHGGAVKHADAAEDRKLVASMMREHEQKEQKIEGKESKPRLDKRARGGRIGRHHTTVNVIMPHRTENVGPVPAVGPSLSTVIPPGGGPLGPTTPMAGPASMRPLPPTAGMARGGRISRKMVETGVPILSGAHGPDEKPPSYEGSIAAAKKKSPRQAAGNKFARGGAVKKQFGGAVPGMGPAMPRMPMVPPTGPLSYPLMGNMGGGPRPMSPFKRGGATPHNGESRKETAKAFRAAHNKKGFASGGRIHAYPKMHAGADSGEGRLEKIEKYGRKAKP